MIRKAEIKDIDDLLRILLQVHDVHATGRPDIFKKGLRKFEYADLKKIIEAGDKPIYVYLEDDTLMGYCFTEYHITKDNHSLCDRKELYIEDLCVDSAYRRKGIASKLFDYVLEVAHSENCDALTLNVWELNKGAKAFYEAQGFQPLKTIMERKL